MIWHDLQDPNDPELDVLAEQFHLHPLHVEDCRDGKQRAKVEEGADYIFVVLSQCTSLRPVKYRSMTSTYSLGTIT